MQLGTVLACSMLWPSWCCKPSPASVLRPAVPPQRKPLPRASPFVERAHLRAVGRRPVEGSVARRFVGNRNFEARAEVGDLRLVEFFLLVGNVAALAGFAEPVTLDGRS